MQNFIKILIVSLAILVCCPTMIFADELTNIIGMTNSVEITDAETEETIEHKMARTDAITRGLWLSDVILQISDPQNGNIGVLMITGCHESVDQILMGVYVDKLAEDQTWSQVDYKLFQFLPEDYSDGILAEAVLNIELTGHELGWYRLRGMHLVEKNGDSEFYSTETQFIEITKRFPFSLEEGDATPAEASDSEVPNEDEQPAEVPETEEESKTPPLATPSELPEQ